ncbi:hypothetical protein HUN39_09475 [Methylocystis sp. FS]|uniref:hypothetical protein n=1 Tax=Methylocystis silviterrae TaxID=2743612 RepID=UPI0015834E6C|nr:hypothetical protein [Methylocystis silviterrae]NUJ80258.1 hypothetical protein [Methylocystis silviterrae]
MPTTLTADLLTQLASWAKKVNKELGASGIYVFGSLIYRNGAQFNSSSDIDVIVVVPPGLSSARERVAWLDRLVQSKKELEARLVAKLQRTDFDSSICSVNTPTILEVTADIHKDGAQGFYANNQFRDLIAGTERRGLPDAGTRRIGERLVVECLRFAQKKRNAYLGVSASGKESLSSYDSNEPAPKDIMRHGAMAQQLDENAEADPGAEYDVQVGLDFLFHQLYQKRRDGDEFVTLYRNLSIRRGARGEVRPLSSKDQLFLAEMIFDAGAAHLVAEQRKRESEQSSPNIVHSTVCFWERFAQAFPGVRGIEWFDEPGAIRERLGILLAPPLVYGSSTPIWWWRGGRNLQITKFAVDGDHYLMDGDELKIVRVAAVNPGPYKHCFVYVEVDALSPIGLYEHTAERIAEVKAGNDVFSFYSEEYAIVDGKHLITRAQYDDGGAVIEGRLQDTRGRAKLRCRYVTPYNFIIAAGGAPIGQASYDQRLEEILDQMLNGQELLPQLSEETMLLRAGRF